MVFGWSPKASISISDNKNRFCSVNVIITSTKTSKTHKGLKWKNSLCKIFQVSICISKQKKRKIFRKLVTRVCSYVTVMYDDVYHRAWDPGNCSYTTPAKSKVPSFFMTPQLCFRYWLPEEHNEPRMHFLRSAEFWSRTTGAVTGCFRINLSCARFIQTTHSPCCDSCNRIYFNRLSE